MRPDSGKIRLVIELRRAGITDTRVLAAMERLPREAFVAESFRDQAYADVTLPIGHGQTISRPLVVALMTQALDVGPRVKVLEIGTGSGYQAAVLARMCRRLYTIERHGPLLAEAEARLRRLRITNVTTRLGDGARGWPEQAPFDRIMVTAAAADGPPPALLGQLKPGGHLVLPVGAAEQRLLRVTRTDAGFAEHDLGPVRFVPLVTDAAAG